MYCLVVTRLNSIRKNYRVLFCHEQGNTSLLEFLRNWSIQLDFASKVYCCMPQKARAPRLSHPFHNIADRLAPVNIGTIYPRKKKKLNSPPEEIITMKTPERSRTSRVGHFLVLSPGNSLCDVT